MANNYIFSEINSHEITPIICIFTDSSWRGKLLFYNLKTKTNKKNYKMEKSARKIHYFYEKCLVSFEECKGSENLSYFQANNVVCKFHGRFWQETWYLRVREKDFITAQQVAWTPLFPQVLRGWHGRDQEDTVYTVG